PPQGTRRWGPETTSVIFAAGQVLGMALKRPRVHVVQEPCKAGDACLVAAGVERERRIVRTDLERLRNVNVPLVDAGCHCVPCDAVRLAASHQAPAWGVQAGDIGKWSVMEIDAAVSRLGQDRIRYDTQIGDTQDPV